MITNTGDTENISPNPLPVCIHNEFCGGCMHQLMPYEKQVMMKGKEVLSLMEKKGADLSGLREPFEAEQLKPAPQLYHYRNKMEYTFGDMVKDGPMTLGMHKKGHFMSIVTVDNCQLVPQDFNILLRLTLDFCTEKGYRFYHKKSHEGLMRNLVLRRGERTDELLINIVTSSQGEFDETGYIAAIESVKERLDGNVVGIIHTFCDSIADAVIPESFKVIQGRDYYMEEIMGLKFKVSAFSFFQTNIAAVERLYTEAVSLIDDFEGKTVFDLFCGTGTISQVLAQKAKKVVGIELVEDAVESAKANAKLNGIENCEFIAGDVFKVIDEVTEKPDVIVVDPPRMGILPKTLDKIAAYGTEQILYISCNPKTLAENIVYLKEYYGYQPVILKAYDNFPMTKHTEAVTLLVRQKPEI
ncbi:MAG: 23S rRNA (uracil(1939)-C(5))-methyltransferase RlmD [Clostridia bacterium]|nr:23S rRNA (uracil(1939)-C(5))-methyltransferase RlmD [Clostridia bacterium]